MPKSKSATDKSVFVLTAKVSISLPERKAINCGSDLTTPQHRSAHDESILKTFKHALTTRWCLYKSPTPSLAEAKHTLPETFKELNWKRVQACSYHSRFPCKVSHRIPLSTCSSSWMGDPFTLQQFAWPRQASSSLNTR